MLGFIPCPKEDLYLFHDGQGFLIIFDDNFGFCFQIFSNYNYLTKLTMGKKPAVGYLINGCYPKGLKETGSNAFYGAVKVPEDVLYNHFYGLLQDSIFASAGSNMEAITSKDEVALKIGSLMNSRFKDKEGEVWVNLCKSVKTGLLKKQFWSVLELQNWVQEKTIEQQVITNKSSTKPLEDSSRGMKESVDDKASSLVQRDVSIQSPSTQTSIDQLRASSDHLACANSCLLPKLVDQNTKLSEANTKFSEVITRLTDENVRLMDENSKLSDKNVSLMDTNLRLSSNQEVLVKERDAAIRERDILSRDTREQVANDDMKQDLVEILEIVKSIKTNSTIFKMGDKKHPWSFLDYVNGNCTVFCSNEIQSIIVKNAASATIIASLKASNKLTFSTTSKGDLSVLVPAVFASPEPLEGTSKVAVLLIEHSTPIGIQSIDQVMAESTASWITTTLRDASKVFSKMMFVFLPLEESGVDVDVPSKQDHALMIESIFKFTLCEDLDPKLFLCLNLDDIGEKLEPAVYCVLLGLISLCDMNGKPPEKPCKECSLFCSPGKCFALRGALGEKKENKAGKSFLLF